MCKSFFIIYCLLHILLNTLSRGRFKEKLNLNMKKLIQIVFCSILLFTFLLPNGFAQKRIAVMGSSTVFGYFPPSSGYTKDSAWVYKIKKYYKDLGVIDTLYNLGQLSTDCFEGMPSSYVPPAGFGYRMPNPNVNITRALNMVPKPDVIIVSYPSNSYDWISVEQVIICLQIIKDSANAKNIPCYITTTQPRNNFNAGERLKLKTLRNMIMAQFGQFAIDFYTDIVEEPTLQIKPIYNVGDGIHLTPSGHTILKDKVLEKNMLSAPLPLKFTLFKLGEYQQKVIIKWETQNEDANQHFIIEHSKDGINFNGIGNIAGKNGSVKNLYEFTHKPALNETQYYRIKSINAQGNSEYSSTASINLRTEILPVQIKFIQPEIIIYFNKEVSGTAFINIYTADGKRVHTTQYKVNGKDILRMKTNNLPAGSYAAKITYNQQNTTGRFIIP